MTFSDFFSRFQGWRRQAPLVSAAQLRLAADQAQQQAERAAVIQGRLFLKKWQDLQEQAEALRAREAEVLQQLQACIAQQTYRQTLLSGEVYSVDFAQGPLWKTFCHEVQELLGQDSVEVSRAQPPLLSFRSQASQKPLQQLYDVRHLEQESDELLHYL